VHHPDPFWIRVLPARLRRRLVGRHAVHAMLANSGWLLADRLLRMFLALVVGAWVARHLGPGRYGVLAYAIALLAFVTPLAMLGLEAIVVRDVAQDACQGAAHFGHRPLSEDRSGAYGLPRG
jgi:PST family polysaccharide transporter